MPNMTCWKILKVVLGMKKFVDWSNEFEEQHKTTDWNSGEYGEYYDEIRKYAKEKIAEYFKEEQTWRRK